MFDSRQGHGLFFLFCECGGGDDDDDDDDPTMR
jgi:hypothetical protein